MTGTTISSIMTMVLDVLGSVWEVFSDMIEAATSNPWLLIGIILGLGSTVIGIAFKVIRKTKKGLN